MKGLSSPPTEQVAKDDAKKSKQIYLSETFVTPLCPGALVVQKK
jgi:hypothetical protein